MRGDADGDPTRTAARDAAGAEAAAGNGARLAGRFWQASPGPSDCEDVESLEAQGS